MMTRRLASAALLAFLFQAAWLLVWPLPRGPLQAAATVVVPSVLFLLAASAAWSWRKGGVAQPLLGAALGTLALWILVLVRNDAHEVGTFGAIIEGAITGGLYTLLGGATFLALARVSQNR
jgi:phosphotransferase system  glucose/maltose/N-acetylglucosamine-specific IIC component